MHITRRHALLAAGSLLAGLSAQACEGPLASDRATEASSAGDALAARRWGTPEEAVAGLTLEQKVAQLFVVCPEAVTGVSVQTAAGEATREALERRPVGGLVYFSPNLVDPDQTREMLASTQAFAIGASGLPCLLAVDEEGGTVARVGSNPSFGVERVGDMALVEDAEHARAAAVTIGNYLADLGFNLDFAPVADIASAEGSPLARRSFGGDPEKVASCVSAQVEGYLSTGVLCAAKHFPGIGGAVGDSHDGSISSSARIEEMEAFELVPFEAAVSAGVPLVMVGHLSCPALTGDDAPASLSPVIVGDVLRGRLGFDGVIVTDSLSMGAVTGLVPPAEAGVRALAAGVDLILMPEDFEAAYQGVLEAVASGSLSEKRIDESVLRVARAKLGLLA